MIMLVPALASCGDNGAASTNTTATTPQNGDSPTNKRIAELQADASGYDGKEFHMVGRYGGAAGDAFPIEDTITGNVESDAVYKRNQAVETAFNVKIVGEKTENGPTAADMVIKDQEAGTKTFHMGYGNIWSTLNILFNKGMFSPINNYAQIDLESPWWLGTMEEFYAIGDTLFFLSGDILPDFFNNAALVLFSKKVMEDFDIGVNLYDLVTEGEWTIDKMFEVAAVIPGGGDIKRYGNANGGAGKAIYFGAGYTITQFEADHMPTIADAIPQEAYDLAVKVSAQTGDESICYNLAFDIEDGSAGLRKMFAENKMLFNFDSAGGVAELREEDANFGILPIPKASADQKSYISLTGTGNDGSIYIPKVVDDPNFVGTIVEAMGAYSYQEIRPTFYDLRLKSKSVYDVESKAMLDIIYSTQVYDLYDLYGGGDFNHGAGPISSAIEEGFFTKTDNLISTYNSEKKLTLKNIKSMVKQAATMS